MPRAGGLSANRGTCAGRKVQNHCERARPEATQRVSGAGQSRRGPGGHGAPPDKCTAAGWRAWDCDACPIYSSIIENTDLESTPCGCGGRPATSRKGRLPARNGISHGGGHLHYGAARAPRISIPESRCLCLLFFSNVYNLISQMIPI